MITSILIEIYERDLNALKKEIQSYDKEAQLWITEKQISNSAGNLCLHIIGNVNHFIGSTLGNTGYVRNREEEFSKKNVPVAEITQAIDASIIMIRKVLSSLSSVDLEKDYPLEKIKKKATTQFWMMQFACHLNYHLGQINYHRRLLSL